MAKHCEPFQGKRVVLVTVNKDYFEMYTNWLGSAAPFLQNSTEHLRIIAEDEEVLAPLHAFMKDLELDYSVESPQAASLVQAEFPYGDKEYGSVVWERPDHILKLLRGGCSVLYVDVDTV